MTKRVFLVRSISFFLAAAICTAPLAAFPFSVFADTDPAVIQCQSVIASASPGDLNNPASKAAQCQSLIDLYAQLAQQQAALAQQQGVSGSLSKDIQALTGQINAKKTEIKAKIAHISVLSNSISEKQQTIVTLSDKIETEKESLAQLLRKTNEMDQVTLSNFLLSGKNLSDFYSDVSRFDTLKAQVRTSVDNIQTIKGVTENTKAQLQAEQNKTIDEKQNLVQAQNSLAQEQSTQKTLLSISKNKEAEYQKVIAQQQAKVAQIKARLFQLAGGGKAIPFGTALQYANAASAKTGIDPAYLLAELTQESNLGVDVGNCYLSDTTSGAGANVRSGRTYPNVMKASRDIPPFLEITSALGYDPLHTAVSCPMSIGYGGAMGPAQFIPSTWKLFVPRLQADLGVSMPNPWNPQDAFMAASLYLTDLGAVGTSASAQLRASCRYYGSGGSTCVYGRNVQALKVGIQSDIDYLNQYGVSRR